MSKTQRREIADLDTHDKDPILHLSTVARAIGRSPQQVGRYVAEGILPSVSVGGMRKVRKSALQAWLGVTACGEDPEVQRRVDDLEGDA